MPLATRRDKETEIIWGIRDFVSRFSRMPEGMWLAETAVDTETLEILAEQGILFTILSPYQARRIRKTSTRSWELTNVEKLDTGRPYLCRLPSGRSIALFFYDHAIASEIAFGSLLNNGEQFVDRMISTFSGRDDSPCLLSIATDGETYGHHHRFADMALSYALHLIEEKELARITIFGEYLESHPPEYEVEIYENTSWSCTHGIGRWNSDCGCRTFHACLISDPGECISLENTTPPYNPRQWNQKWRGPLREAMDNLNVSLSAMYQKDAPFLFSNPAAARNEYIDLILDKSEECLQSFISKHMIPGLSSDQVIRALKLLEVQRNALLMYTSCGWFFDELSGIETVQVMMYACRAIELAQDLSGYDYEPAFTGILSRAVSNIPSTGTGADVYEKYVKTSVVQRDQIACFCAISTLISGPLQEKSLYRYHINCGGCKIERSNNLGLLTGTLILKSQLTHEESHLIIVSIWIGELVYVGGIKDYVSEVDGAQIEQNLWDAFGRRDNQELIRSLKKNCNTTIPFRHIFPDGRRRIQESVLAATMVELESHLCQVFTGEIPLVKSLSSEGNAPPAVLISLEQYMLNAEVRRCLESNEGDIRLLQHAVTRLIMSRASPDNRMLSGSATGRISRDIRKIMLEPHSLQNISVLNLLFRVLMPLSLPLDLRESQNLYFACHSQCIDNAMKNVQGDEESQKLVDEIRDLGKHLEIYDPSLSAAENRSPDLH